MNDLINLNYLLPFTKPERSVHAFLFIQRSLPFYLIHEFLLFARTFTIMHPSPREHEHRFDLPSSVLSFMQFLVRQIFVLYFLLLSFRAFAPILSFLLFLLLLPRCIATALVSSCGALMRWSTRPRSSSPITDPRMSILRGGRHKQAGDGHRTISPLLSPFPSFSFLPGSSKKQHY